MHYIIGDEMRCENTWLGKFYLPETKEEEEMLKSMGYRKIICGFGAGWWHKWDGIL